MASSPSNLAKEASARLGREIAREYPSIADEAWVLLEKILLHGEAPRQFRPSHAKQLLGWTDWEIDKAIQALDGANLLVKTGQRKWRILRALREVQDKHTQIKRELERMPKRRGAEGTGIALSKLISRIHPIRIVLGHGFQDDRIRIQCNPRYVAPKELEPVFQEYERHLLERMKTGQHFHNGYQIGLGGIHLAPTDLEEQRTFLEVRPIRYFQARCQWEWMEERGMLPARGSDATLRREYVERDPSTGEARDPRSNCPRELPCQFGIIVAVRTSDGQYAICRRRRHLGVEPGSIQCTVSEGATEKKLEDFDPSDRSKGKVFVSDLRGSSGPFPVRRENEVGDGLDFFKENSGPLSIDPWALAYRALREELGLGYHSLGGTRFGSIFSDPMDALQNPERIRRAFPVKLLGLIYDDVRVEYDLFGFLQSPLTGAEHEEMFLFATDDESDLLFMEAARMKRSLEEQPEQWGRRGAWVAIQVLKIADPKFVPPSVYSTA